MTPPPRGRRPPLVIAHLSDLHLGAHHAGARDSVAADVTAVRPALTVVTGDLTMRARNAQFRQARALLDRLPRPLLVVPGNHDLPLVSTVRLIDPYGRYQRWIQPDLDQLVRVPGLTALGLESTPRWRWKSGRVSARQTDEAVALLDAAPADTVRLLAMHHPPFASGPARVAGRERLSRALAAARVDLVLAGHTHLPLSRWVTVGDRHELLEVVAGTATSLRTRGVGRSWTVIRIEEGAVVVQERYDGAAGWCRERSTCYPGLGSRLS